MCVWSPPRLTPRYLLYTPIRPSTPTTALFQYNGMRSSTAPRGCCALPAYVPCHSRIWLQFCCPGSSTGLAKGACVSSCEMSTSPSLYLLVFCPELIRSRKNKEDHTFGTGCSYHIKHIDRGMQTSHRKKEEGRRRRRRRRREFLSSNNNNNNSKYITKIFLEYILCACPSSCVACLSRAYSGCERAPRHPGEELGAKVGAGVPTGETGTFRVPQPRPSHRGDPCCSALQVRRV